MDIASLLGLSSQDNQPSKLPFRSIYYQLSAVIVHFGDQRSGHFITYRRLNGTHRCWVRVSDTQVTRADIQQVLRSHAYMLFYERVHGNELNNGHLTE